MKKIIARLMNNLKQIISCSPCAHACEFKKCVMKHNNNNNNNNNNNSSFVHQGAASMKEFYAKNSRWTEGLISASKAVGWGATVMV